MTKSELQSLLDQCSDTARIAIVQPNGLVKDIDEALICKARDGWFTNDELQLFQKKAPL
jgi:hypothetical protein